MAMLRCSGLAGANSLENKIGDNRDTRPGY